MQEKNKTEFYEKNLWLVLTCLRAVRLTIQLWQSWNLQVTYKHKTTRHVKLY